MIPYLEDVVWLEKYKDIITKKPFKQDMTTYDYFQGQKGIIKYWCT